MTAAEGGSSGAPTISFEGQPLQLGITTPVLTMLPDNHASWEVDATIEDVAEIAKAADRLKALDSEIATLRKTLAEADDASDPAVTGTDNVM